MPNGPMFLRLGTRYISLGRIVTIREAYRLNEETGEKTILNAYDITMTDGVHLLISQPGEVAGLQQYLLDAEEDE